MAYTCDLGGGLRLYVEEQGRQTILTLATISAGQQQSQSSSFETGGWVLAPTLFRTPEGLFVRIQGTEGQFAIQLQGNATILLTETPSLTGAEVLPLEQQDASVSQMPPMSGMKPMEPMKPMRMEPMEMRMGNMEMRMGTPTVRSEATATGASRFCPNCGNGVDLSDRFCSQCGNRITTS